MGTVNSWLGVATVEERSRAEKGFKTLVEKWIGGELHVERNLGAHKVRNASYLRWRGNGAEKEGAGGSLHRRSRGSEYHG